MGRGKADPGQDRGRHGSSPVAQGSEDEAPEEELLAARHGNGHHHDDQHRVRGALVGRQPVGDVRPVVLEAEYPDPRRGKDEEAQPHRDR